MAYSIEKGSPAIRFVGDAAGRAEFLDANNQDYLAVQRELMEAIAKNIPGGQYKSDTNFRSLEIQLDNAIKAAENRANRDPNNDELAFQATFYQLARKALDVMKLDTQYNRGAPPSTVAQTSGAPAPTGIPAPAVTPAPAGTLAPLPIIDPQNLTAKLQDFIANNGKDLDPDPQQDQLLRDQLKRSAGFVMDNPYVDSVFDDNMDSQDMQEITDIMNHLLGTKGLITGQDLIDGLEKFLNDDAQNYTGAQRDQLMRSVNDATNGSYVFDVFDDTLDVAERTKIQQVTDDLKAAQTPTRNPGDGYEILFVNGELQLKDDSAAPLAAFNEDVLNHNALVVEEVKAKIIDSLDPDGNGLASQFALDKMTERFEKQLTQSGQTNIVLAQIGQKALEAAQSELQFYGQRNAYGFEITDKGIELTGDESAFEADMLNNEAGVALKILSAIDGNGDGVIEKQYYEDLKTKFDEQLSKPQASLEQRAMIGLAKTALDKAIEDGNLQFKEGPKVEAPAVHPRYDFQVEVMQRTFILNGAGIAADGVFGRADGQLSETQKALAEFLNEHEYWKTFLPEGQAGKYSDEDIDQAKKEASFKLQDEGAALEAFKHMVDNLGHDQLRSLAGKASTAIYGDNATEESIKNGQAFLKSRDLYGKFDDKNEVTGKKIDGNPQGNTADAYAAVLNQVEALKAVTNSQPHTSHVDAFNQAARNVQVYGTEITQETHPKDYDEIAREAREAYAEAKNAGMNVENGVLMMADTSLWDHKGGAPVVIKFDKDNTPHYYAVDSTSNLKGVAVHEGLVDDVRFALKQRLDSDIIMSQKVQIGEPVEMEIEIDGVPVVATIHDREGAFGQHRAEIHSVNGAPYGDNQPDDAAGNAKEWKNPDLDHTTGTHTP